MLFVLAGQLLYPQLFVYYVSYARKKIEMKKLFTESGFLSDFGEGNFAQFLDGEILHLLNEANSEDEIRIIGSLIQHRVGNLIADQILKKKK